MMEFSVGDKVIHPRFGAGEITGETHRELVAGFEHYYVIKVVRTGATAYVPMGKMDELGVRLVMSQEKMVQVFITLRDVPRILEKDYKQRQAKILEKLVTARSILVAEVIRDLSWRKKEKHLTQMDENLLSRGMNLLASEMALATDAEEFEVQETIDAALSFAMKGADEPERLSGEASAPAMPRRFLNNLSEGIGKENAESVSA